jgi:hypothetical protein
MDLFQVSAPWREPLSVVNSDRCVPGRGVGRAVEIVQGDVLAGEEILDYWMKTCR